MGSLDIPKGLEPSLVWAHFAALCAIPRPSRHEQAVRQHLVAWACARGIAHETDAVGNLILRKPASPGCGNAPGVILQAHLDMVCQANRGTRHDFLRDPIRAVVRDGWVMAETTTLGADNGIGVALALAALEHPGLVHPALEVLLTVNEESGMDGARGLQPGTLCGARLINLDAEEWGHLYLGCAGGVDVEVRHTCALEPLPPGYAVLRFEVSGLRGGHSGIDIHLGRGNAIKLLAEALRDLAAHTDVRLIEMQGGTARNAIPREAYARCAVPAAAVPGMAAWVEHRLKSWQQRFREQDAGVTFGHVPDEVPTSHALPHAERDRVLAFLDVSMNGVAEMSRDFPDVVETSDNLGVLRLAQGEFKATFKVRSLHDERAAQLAEKLVVQAAGYGLSAHCDGAYPAWPPNPNSGLLAVCRQMYAEKFSVSPELQVIHAGLECGLLAASHPHLDMVSLGPTICGAHAPGERVEIASVAHCWAFLQAVLEKLAQG